MVGGFGDADHIVLPPALSGACSPIIMMVGKWFLVTIIMIGIGDKHIPWIHDCKNTDFTIAVDDEIPVSLLCLFNAGEGKAALIQEGISQDLVNNLYLLSISDIENMVAAIKFAQYNELAENDYVVSRATRQECRRT